MDITISWRNIWRNKRRTYVILTAILIGVSSMIFLGSLMRGMMEGMIENAIHEMTGHIKIQNILFRQDPSIDNLIKDPDSVLNELKPILPDKTKIAKRIILESVVNTARDSAGVKLVAIDYKDEKDLSFIGQAEISGKVFENNDVSSAIIGRALSKKLGLGINKRFVLTAQNKNGEVASRSFTITGMFKGDMEAVEKTYVFISKKGAQKLLGLNQEVTEISIKLPYKNISKKDFLPIKEKINNRLDKSIKAQTWRELLPAIDGYISIFNQFLFIWYLVVFIAMGFGIVNTVLMAVFERMREFGLLKAIGMRPLKIFNMVVMETLFLLAIGMIAGNLIAFLLIFIFSPGIDLSAFASGAQMWGIKRVVFPVIDSRDIITANLTVFVLGLVVGVYPAIKAAKFSPIETMRMN